VWAVTTILILLPELSSEKSSKKSLIIYTLSNEENSSLPFFDNYFLQRHIKYLVVWQFNGK